MGCRVFPVADARVTAMEGDGKNFDKQQASHQHQRSKGVGVVSALECLRQLGLLVEVHILQF